MAKRKRTKRETTVHKALHRKPTIEEHVPYKKPGMNSGTTDPWLLSYSRGKQNNKSLLSEKMCPACVFQI